MYHHEARRAFLEAMPDEKIAAADRLARTAGAMEASVIHLHCAETAALTSGKPGVCASQLFGAVETGYSDELLWETMLDVALKDQDAALICRMLSFRVEKAVSAHDKAVALVEFGHALRFWASEYGEAAKAYVEAVETDPDFLTVGLVALHQLRRQLFSSRDAAENILCICEKNNISDQEYQCSMEQMRSLKSTQNKARSDLLLNLTKLSLCLWGDTGRAMQWFSQALTIEDVDKMAAAQLIFGVGEAIPDSSAVLSECVAHLKRLEAWPLAFALNKILLRHSETPRQRLKWSVDTARCAFEAHLSWDVVSHYIFGAAYAFPEAWFREIDQAEWIERAICKSPAFGADLQALLNQLNVTEASEKVVDSAAVRSLASSDQSSAGVSDDMFSNLDALCVESQQRKSEVKTALVENNKASKTSSSSDTQSWKLVVSYILKYVPRSLAWHARYPVEGDNLVQSFDNPEQAYPVLSDALSEMIQNRGFFLQVMQMNENENQQRLYMAKLDEAIALYAGDTSKKNALLAKKYHLAEILGDDRAKLTCLKEILETTPDDPFATQCVLSLTEDTLKPHAQIMLCQLQAFIIKDPVEHFQKRLHLAQLYVRSSQNNNAINLYHALIDEQPENLAPRYELLELLVQLENWKSAENVLLSLINLETDEKCHFLNLVRLATIQDDKMMMPSRALLTLFAALDVCPDIEGMHKKLCSISEKLHSYSPLIDKYEELAGPEHELSVRSIATLMLAEIYSDKLNKNSMASRILVEFYEGAGASDLDYVRDMAAFCEKLNLWKEFVRACIHIAEHTSEKREIVASYLNAAEAFAIHLGNGEEAVLYARRAASKDPDNADDWISIAQILAMFGAGDVALNALQRALRFQVGAERAKTLLLIAQIYADAEDLEESTRMFHLAAVIHPGLEALTPIGERIIALATTRHNQEAFVTVCNDLVEACSDEEKIQLLLQQALTLARVFDDENAARSIVDSIRTNVSDFDLEQSCMLADILTLIHEERASTELNIRILKQNALSDQDRFDRLQSMLVNAKHLEDISLVREVCMAILELDPEDSNANFHLIQIDYIAGKWDIAAGRIQKFLPYTERLNAESAMLMQYYYADILHAAEHDDMALENLNNALSIRGDYRPAVDLKLTILLEHRRWLDSLPLFKELLSLTHDDDEKGAIHKRIAEIWHFYLNDNLRAIEEYELALTLGGDVEDVPIRLLSLYSETENWQKAAITAQILAQAQTSSSEARLEYLLVLGDIWGNHLGESALAANTYMDAFDIGPLNEKVVVPLVKVLLKRRDDARLLLVAQRLVALASRQFDPAISTLTLLFKLSLKSVSARTVLEKTLASLNEHFPGEPAIVPLAQLLELSPVDEASMDGWGNSDLPPAPPTQAPSKRKRIITSPRGSLQVDSGFIANLDSGVRLPPSTESGLRKLSSLVAEPVLNEVKFKESPSDSGIVIGRPMVGDSGLREAPVETSLDAHVQIFDNHHIEQNQDVLRIENDDDDVPLIDFSEVELTDFEEDDQFLPYVESSELLVPVDGSIKK